LFFAIVRLEATGASQSIGQIVISLITQVHILFTGQTEIGFILSLKYLN